MSTSEQKAKENVRLTPYNGCGPLRFLDTGSFNIITPHSISALSPRGEGALFLLVFGRRRHKVEEEYNFPPSFRSPRIFGPCVDQRDLGQCCAGPVAGEIIPNGLAKCRQIAAILAMAFRASNSHDHQWESVTERLCKLSFVAVPSAARDRLLHAFQLARQEQAFGSAFHQVALSGRTKSHGDSLAVDRWHHLTALKHQVIAVGRSSTGLRNTSGVGGLFDHLL